MSGEETSYYPFDADRAEEERRLIALGGLSEPNTERVFRQAGLGAGMRVLDLGAGAGDVALLVARLVGPQGSVLGVEQSAEAVARAQRRIGVVIPVSLLKEPREPLRFILNRVYVPSPDAAPHA